MIVPVFLVVLFSIVGADATFGFSIVFTNTFIGLFLTSYLVIEEKNKDTLLALLTTPLTALELLIGKVSFNLVLCLLFSVFSIVINKRFDLFLNAPALIALFLLASTCCFCGFLLGIFCRNEQELSILGPFVLLIFGLGDAFQKIPGPMALHPFFPDYHLAQNLKAFAMGWGKQLYHLSFSFLYFFIAIVGVSQYTQFYFSNNREKRVSRSLLVFIFLFLTTFLLSGLLTNQLFKEKIGQLGGNQFETQEWAGRLNYPKDEMHLVPLVQVKNKIILAMKLKKSKNVSFVFTIRPTEADEATEVAREVAVRADRTRILLSMEKLKVKEHEFTRWVYIKDEKLVVLTEHLCRSQLAQLSVDLEFKTGATPKAYLEIYQRILQNLELECKAN